MEKKISGAVLGSTGYVGLELINILSRHPSFKIIFLGSENFSQKDIRDFDNRIINDTLPILDQYKNINYTTVEQICLAYFGAMSPSLLRRVVMEFR